MKLFLQYYRSKNLLTLLRTKGSTNYRVKYLGLGLTKKYIFTITEVLVSYLVNYFGEISLILI